MGKWVKIGSKMKFEFREKIVVLIAKVPKMVLYPPYNRAEVVVIISVAAPQHPDRRTFLRLHVARP